MDEIEREAYREYDLRGLFGEARQRVLDKYSAGEITEAEMEEKLTNLAENTETAERLEEHMVKMKEEKYEKLQEKYVNDEITEAEMEEEMDSLFQSGDDFLEAESEAGPRVPEGVMFRLKEVAQVLGFFGYIGAAIYVVLMTNGAAFIPIIAVTIIGLLAYSRFKGKI